MCHACAKCKVHRIDGRDRDGQSGAGRLERPERIAFTSGQTQRVCPGVSDEIGFTFFQPLAVVIILLDFICTFFIISSHKIQFFLKNNLLRFRGKITVKVKVLSSCRTYLQDDKTLTVLTV